MKFISTSVLLLATMAVNISAAALSHDARQQPDTTLKRSLPAAPSPLPLRAAPRDASPGPARSLPPLPLLDVRQASDQIDSTHADRESAETALDDSRAEGRRRLSGTTASCKSGGCHTCMNASTTASLAEIAGCGLVAAAAEVGSSGTATAFVVAGFAACETAVTANMAKSVVECEAFNP